MEPELILMGSKHAITCIYQGYNHLISGDVEGGITLWNIKTRRPKLSWKTHSKTILNVGYLPSKVCLVTQGREGLIKLWKYENNQLKEQNSIESAEYTYCKMYICHLDAMDVLGYASNDVDNTVEMIEYPADVVAGQIVLGNGQGMIMSVNVIDRGRVVVGMEDGAVALFEAGVRLWQIKAVTSVMAIAVSMAAARIAVVGPDNDEGESLVTMNISDGASLQTPDKSSRGSSEMVTGMAWRADGRLLALASDSGFVRLLSGGRGRQLAVLQWRLDPRVLQDRSSSENYCLCFGDDNKLYSCEDKTICVWNVYPTDNSSQETELD